MRAGNRRGVRVCVVECGSILVRLAGKSFYLQLKEWFARIKVMIFSAAIQQVLSR
jgi:hypothetical protein